MAKKKKKKKKKGSQTIFYVLGIGGFLIIAQVFYLLNQGKPLTVQDAIGKALSQQRDLSSRQREQKRIQLAVVDYMANNNQVPPPTLAVLVPRYFDVVPIDPRTSQPFSYRVQNNRYFVGEAGEDNKSTTKGSGGGKSGVEGISSDEQQFLLAMFDEEQTESFVYDPAGKRDPFKPFDAAPDEDDSDKTPLERYNIGQLRLTAVLDGFDEPKAIVENNAGIGFTVAKGDKIGTNSGEVVEILPDKILILETRVDFTGQKRTETLEMKLRTKDQDERRGRSSGGQRRMDIR